MTRFIVTAQPRALSLALAEIGSPRVIRTLESGIVLCERPERTERPVFVRHICPADLEIPVAGEARDIEVLAGAMRRELHRLVIRDSFSVQTRILCHTAYKRFDVNMALAREVEAAGARLDVRTPRQVVSVTLAEGTGYIGISDTIDNISDWAGGARRYKWENGQISRAEFKLLEALEVFRAPLADGQRALDLGASPGGWTRVLRRHGLYVTAVDPAALDPRIVRDTRVTHFRGTAQAYFAAPKRFDVLVNDMKMDSDGSARLTAEGARCLSHGGRAIMTLKLPDNTNEWLPRIQQAKAILQDHYKVAAMRQLFHNRNEVTVYLHKSPVGLPTHPHPSC